MTTIRVAVAHALVALALAGLLVHGSAQRVGAAPVPRTPVPAIEASDVAGIWLVSWNGGNLRAISFGADGTFNYCDLESGALLYFGTWVLEPSGDPSKPNLWFTERWTYQCNAELCVSQFATVYALAIERHTGNTMQCRWNGNRVAFVRR